MGPFALLRDLAGATPVTLCAGCSKVIEQGLDRQWYHIEDDYELFCYPDSPLMADPDEKIYQI